MIPGRHCKVEDLLWEDIYSTAFCLLLSSATLSTSPGKDVHGANTSFQKRNPGHLPSVRTRKEVWCDRRAHGRMLHIPQETLKNGGLFHCHIPPRFHPKMLFIKRSAPQQWKMCYVSEHFKEKNPSLLLQPLRGAVWRQGEGRHPCGSFSHFFLYSTCA